MDKERINELIEAFELCKTVIKLLHPVLDPEEPCIVYEAHEAASDQIVRLRNLINRSSGPSEICGCGEPDCYVWYNEKYCYKCGLTCA